MASNDNSQLHIDKSKQNNNRVCGIEKFGLNSVDVKEILLEMRKFRMGLIQTPEQLRFSYQAIIEGVKQLLNQNSEPEEVVSDCREVSDSEDDEPPPLPPPRLDSLKQYNGTSLNRPLPNIPNSISDNDLSYENNDKIEKAYIPSGPLPVVPAGEEDYSEEDELEARSESSISDKSDFSNSVKSVPPSELRHRKRIERKENMEAQVRDMKRRQQLNEQWTQLKRSLYIPLVIGGSLILGGGLITYFYFKS